MFSLLFSLLSLSSFLRKVAGALFTAPSKPLGTICLMLLLMMMSKNVCPNPTGESDEDEEDDVHEV